MENEKIEVKKENTNDQSSVQNKIETKKKEKKSNPSKIIAIFLIIISFVLIGGGIYFTYLSNSKKIVGSAIETMTGNFKDLFLSENENLKIGDNFTIVSDVSLNIQSDYLTTLAAQTAQNNTGMPVSPEQNQTMQIQTYQKLLNNLEKTKNTITIKQDKTNKKAYLELDSNLNSTKLINTKYLIENSTEYYFVEGFLNTYVNNGSSNYFEALDEQTTNHDNMIYLYDFIMNSLKENLKDEYFIKEQETTKIFDEEKKMTKVILKIDNIRAKEIASAILKDLQNDKQASKILTSYDKDFSKKKIKNDAVIFEDGESITINSYANNLFYDIEKVEIVSISSEEQMKLVYETKEEKALLSLIENDKIVGTVDINKVNDKKYNLIIKDDESKEIGTLKFDKSNNQNNIELSINSEGDRIDLSYSSKASDIKDKSYKLESDIVLKVIVDNTSMVNANIKLDSKVSREVEIKEDTASSVLASTVTEADSQRLEQILTQAITKLMS